MVVRPSYFQSEKFYTSKTAIVILVRRLLILFVTSIILSQIYNAIRVLPFNYKNMLN